MNAGERLIPWDSPLIGLVHESGRRKVNRKDLSARWRYFVDVLFGYAIFGRERNVGCAESHVVD